ncbi:diguanylate cyclase [Duganella sp. sic0402]|nr:diguanylate cyclase [Duganella sp. sic0402]
MSTKARAWLVHARVVLLLILCCLSGPSLAVDASALPHGSLSLTPYLTVLEDLQSVLDFDAARQRASAFRSAGKADEALSFGYTRSTYWLRLELTNPTDKPLDRMLEISNARLSDIQFYRPDAQGRYSVHRTGSAHPYATRPYPNRYYVYTLQLAPHAQEVIYVRIWSEGAKLIPMTLWEPIAYAAYERQDYLVQGAYFGTALAMTLFNLVLFLTLRDRLYLLYVAFVLFTVIALSGQNGLAHEWLWPAIGGSWPNKAASLGFSLSAGMLTVFMRRMINTREVVPRLDWILRVLLVFFFTAPIATIFFYVETAGQITTAWAVCSPLIMLVGVVCALKRQRSAYYFTAAFVLLFVGNSSSSLAALAILPHNPLTNYGSQIGSCVEMMMLAFALADRVNVMRREKETAQREALEAQANLIVGLQASERMLELRVEQRTHELQVANDHLAALSMTDGLTGIANRRRFDEVLAAEWGRAARQQHPLAIGLLDIDFFKQYNDHYGHQAGDDCLRRVAQAFKAQLQRGGDLVARYGGEEFVFIAPAVDAERAMRIADAVCKAIESLGLPHIKTPGGTLTVSIGVAAWIPLPGTSSQDILRAADQALYRAKQLGRNRAEVH